MRGWRRWRESDGWIRGLIVTGVLILPAILSYAGPQPPAAAVGRDYAYVARGPALADWTEQAKLIPVAGAPNDNFGYSASINGNYAIIGAIGDGNQSGAAYIFVHDAGGWTEQAKLTARGRAPGDIFGHSVSVSGDTAIIGVPGDTDSGANAGAAYIFVRDRDTWSEQAKLTARDGIAGDQFGWRVSISGDTAMVGAIGDDDNGTSSGSVYVFVRDEGTWTEQLKLAAGDGSAGDRFGWRVSISGDTAIVAARGLEDENGDYSGSAYVFARDAGGWTQQARLSADDGTPSDRFGYSVAIGEDTAIIGAIGDDDNGNFSGSAYIFVRNGSNWTQQAKLSAGDGAAWDRFGYSVSINGDTAIVGAAGASGNVINAGAAYVFVRSGETWTQQTKLTAGDGDELDQFGYSVSISGDTAVVGAIRDDDNGDSSGSAYVFQRPAATPTRTPSPMPSSTPTPTTTPPAPTTTPTATSTSPPRLNYLPLIAHQWRQPSRTLLPTTTEILIPTLPPPTRLSREGVRRNLPRSASSGLSNCRLTCLPD
ncbi:MAG: FG-GAP repeat protein [Anaerolineae bacterium]